MKKSKFRILIVLLILLIFPFLSWYYLKSGMEYRMDAIAELERLGDFQIDGSYDFRDRYIDPEIFSGKFIVAGIVPKSYEDKILFASRFTGLVEQFSSRDEVLFINLIEYSPNHSGSEIAQFLYNSYPGTVFNHLILEYDVETISNFENRWFKNGTELEMDFEDYLYLVGRDGGILQAYDFKDENRVARLVEHLAMQFTGSQNRRDYSDAIRQKL